MFTAHVGILSHTECQDPTIYPFFLLMLHVLPVSTFVSLKAGFYGSVAYKNLILGFLACLLYTLSHSSF